MSDVETSMTAAHEARMVAAHKQGCRYARDRETIPTYHPLTFIAQERFPDDEDERNAFMAGYVNERVRMGYGPMIPMSIQ